MNTLADELVRLILEPAFIVSNDHFADNGPSSPFAKVPQSAGEFLRVCKRWMRITTPLLYETVVIRSRAQAQSLSLALSRSPEFGSFTKRLRLEGVYGDFLTPDIYETMPNVKQLCFTVSIHHTNDISGLQRAFELFDVERVVLTLHGNSLVNRHKIRARLIEDIADAIITHWSNLKHFTLSHSKQGTDRVAESILLPALAQAPRLATLTAWCGSLKFPNAKQFAVLRTNPSFQHLFLQGHTKPDAPNDPVVTLEGLPAEIRAYARVVPTDYCGTSVYEQPVVEHIGTPANEFWIPLAQVPQEERINFWARVLGFALKLSKPVDTRNLPWAVGQRYNSTSFDLKQVDLAGASACIKVSKDFYMASKRALASSVALPSCGSEDFRRFAAQDPFLLSHVRSMGLYCTRGFKRQFPSDEDLVDGGLLHRLNRLQDLSITETDRVSSALTRIWPVLHLVTGRLLVSLSVQVDFIPDGVQLLADLFKGLDALERLEWDVPAAQFTLSDLATGGNGYEEQRNTEASSLPRLQELRTTAAHSTFYATLARFDLPCFRSLIMTYYVDSCFDLLQAHGSKIITLGVTDKHLTQPLFDLVPNATTLSLHMACAEPKAWQKQSRYFNSPAVEYDLRPFTYLQHVHLRRIIPLWELQQFPWYKTLAETLRRGVGAGNLPALREIQPDPHMQYKYDIWPKTEREVRQNLWVPLHKTLAQVKVALLDFYGQPYRDRKVYVQKREKQPDMPVILQTRLRSARRSPVVANGSEGPTIEDEFTAPTTEAAAEASIKIAGPTRRSTRSAGTAGSAPVASSSSSSSSITAPRRSSRKK